MKPLIWTTEKIKNGIEKFVGENGRLPTTQEIDRISYLPSSRQLERRFGGVQKLREFLGYKDIHLGKGVFRSSISKKIGPRGREIERKLEKILKEHFGEVFVHTEKIFDDTKHRVDFYIYSPDGNFGIDVFYADNIRNLQNSINIKINKYNSFPEELYFVVANPLINQIDLDKYMEIKKKLPEKFSKKLPKNSKIITEEILFKLIKEKRVYPDPLRRVNGL